MIEAVTGVIPGFVAMKGEISPVPFVPIPMEGSELIQINCVPVTNPEKEIKVVSEL